VGILGTPSTRAAFAQPAFTNGLTPNASPVPVGRRIRIGMPNNPRSSDPNEWMTLLSIPGAQLYYAPQFLASDEADHLFETLMRKCVWQRHTASFGQPVPRDEANDGDADSYYTYSRRPYRPLPWIPELLVLKTSVEKATPAEAYSNLGLPNLGYNAVLCNLYRNGNDSVGLHADAEPEMGPVIASVSLGTERLFRLRGKNGRMAFAERLQHGSLLIMAGDTQNNFRHEVPKDPVLLSRASILRSVESTIRKVRF